MAEGDAGLGEGCHLRVRRPLPNFKEPAGSPLPHARGAWRCPGDSWAGAVPRGRPASRCGAEGRAAARPRRWNTGFWAWGPGPGRAAPQSREDPWGSCLSLLRACPWTLARGTPWGLRYAVDLGEGRRVERDPRAGLPVLRTSLPGKAELKQETISFSCHRVVPKQWKKRTLIQARSEPMSQMCSSCYRGNQQDDRAGVEEGVRSWTKFLI